MNIKTKGIGIEGKTLGRQGQASAKSGVESFEWSSITLARLSQSIYEVNRYLFSIRMKCGKEFERREKSKPAPLKIKGMRHPKSS